MIALPSSDPHGRRSSSGAGSSCRFAGPNSSGAATLNPMSESQFKTAKWHPGYPGRFKSLHSSRGYFKTL